MICTGVLRASSSTRFSWITSACLASLTMLMMMVGGYTAAWQEQAKAAASVAPVTCLQQTRLPVSTARAGATATPPAEGRPTSWDVTDAARRRIDAQSL